MNKKPKTYRSRELAELFDIHENSVRTYANKVSAFLSRNATAAKRKYSEKDARIIYTVSKLRDTGISFEEITDIIKAGDIENTLPELPSPEEAEAREQVEIVHIPKQERALEQQAFQHRIDMLVQERDRLLVQIEELESDVNSITTQKDNLQSRVMDLERSIAAANAKLEIIQSERRPLQFWLIVLAIAIFTVVIIAAIVVMYLNGN